MADPLSVAGLALAVVSLGLQVTGGIAEYFDSLKSRGQDIDSITRQNDTLRKTLRIIELSISQFQNDHKTATEALRQFLDSSNGELKVLESMIATFIIDDEGTAGRRNKARNQGKKLLYPFHRSKVEQMATKLHHINATFLLGLQSLGLSVSHLGSEKLATLQATSQIISRDLLVVQSEVSSIRTPIRGIETTLSQFETRFSGLENLLGQLFVQGSAINETLQEITPSEVAGRLLSKPAVLKEMCDAVVTQERHRSTGKLPVPHESAAKVAEAEPRYTGGRFSCLCRHRRHVQRWNAALGSFVLSHETITERHLPGCPAPQATLEPDRRQSFALTYAGLRYFLNSAIQFSFTMRSGAGGSSFGPNFTYYPIVDSNCAPAFRMLNLLISSHTPIQDRLGESAWRKELVPSVVSSVLSLFQGQHASPRAVNVRNESLVYSLALCLRYCYGGMSLLQRQEDASPLLELLEYLLDSKAPANDYSTNGDTPLNEMFSTTSFISINHPVLIASADLILRSNNETVAVDRRPGQPWSRKVVSASGEVIWTQGDEALLRFLSYSTIIADGLCSHALKLPSSVMLTKTFFGIWLWSTRLGNFISQSRRSQTLNSKPPQTLSEINVFGHTPLHLAADKPSILRVLVDAADTSLLNWTDKTHRSALELAVIFSGMNCKEHRSRMWKRCRCAECAVILLKADCMTRTAALQYTLNHASKRCKLRYLNHMKDRRDRLKCLSLGKLSATDIEQLNLESGHVLDSNAFQVTQLLQRRGICVPEALAVVADKWFPHPYPIYETITSSSDADILFCLGFRDTESWCDSYDLERWHVSGRKSLSYLRWLANHGGICCQLPFQTTKDIFGSAYIFSAMGSEIQDSWTSSCFRYGQSNESDGGNSLPTSPTMDPAEDWYHEVHSAVFDVRTVDSCGCQCSPGGCNMLTFILRELINERDYKYKPRLYSRNHAMTDAEDPGQGMVNSTESSESSFIEENPLLELIDGYIIYLSHFSCHFRRWHHYATIRFITFAALGMGHSCCRWDGVNRLFEDDVEDTQDYKMALLEDLINEFEEAIISVLEDPDIETHQLIDFWEQTWVGRMSDVLDHLEGSDDLTEDEKLAAEEIGVVWDKVGPELPEPGPKEKGNPYQRNMIEYWLYELRMIEEECQ